MNKRTIDRKAIKAILRSFELDPDEEVPFGMGTLPRFERWDFLLSSHGIKFTIKMLVEEHCSAEQTQPG
jgi:hypothetical protein|tara:strand:+ start:223 stop:429 length:207 start_codon:yes stop_codon:yes gene_type:complete